jgi:hypothetical protein
MQENGLARRCFFRFWITVAQLQEGVAVGVERSHFAKQGGAMC